jgi:hypothetical protein
MYAVRHLVALAFLIGTTSAGLGEGFDRVIPGRPGVPVIINGLDVSYAVIEGEFGLGRGNPVPKTIYGARPIAPEPPVGHYYPSLGLRPGYGRLEIEPPGNRKLPQPAESYYRSWSAQSAPLPPQSDVPQNPPPIVVGPEINRREDGPRIPQAIPKSIPKPPN